MSKIEISVCVPLYKCSASIPELYERLTRVLTDITSDQFQLVFVNDGSPENDWEVIKSLAAKDKRITALNLSRNFGQHCAITAGLSYCQGSWIVVMDGDLQDQPEHIALFYAEAKKGFEVVFGRRVARQDKLWKKSTSQWFYKVFDYLTDGNSDPTASNFGIFSRSVIASYLSMNEHTRHFPLLIRWLGYKAAYVDITHAERKHGRSAYNFLKLVNFALEAIISHSNKPLRLSVKFGMLLAALSFTTLAFIIARKLMFDVAMGWASVMVAIFFVGGCALLQIGLVGLYIGKIYDETKNRPHFVVQEALNA